MVRKSMGEKDRMQRLEDLLEKNGGRWKGRVQEEQDRSRDWKISGIRIGEDG
jgi:hypothetical protein